MRVPIETFNDGIKRLLTRSVPYLHLDVNMLVYLYYLGVILNTQRNRVLIQKLIGQVTLN